jgi:hypothetical protein
MAIQKAKGERNQNSGAAELRSKRKEREHLSLDSLSSCSSTESSFLFSWYLRKQDIAAQNTAEAEYVAATAAMNQVI